MPHQPIIHYTIMDSPIGEIMFAATDKGLCWLTFGSEEPAVLSLKRWAKSQLQCEQVVNEQTPLLVDALKQFQQYFAGERLSFDIPLDVYGTAFQKKVWDQLTKIPYGEVCSYKDVAIAIGAPKAVRAVGGANNRNPLSIIVPCHRVVGSNGALVGYGGGLNVKEFLLRLEKAN